MTATLLKHVAVTRDVIGPLRDISGNLVSDDAAMCDVLNSYVGSVFTKEQVDGNAPEAKLSYGSIWMSVIC